MLIATALLVLGLLVGVVAVQWRALRMAGVLVIPLLAVYTLYNYATLPVFLASAVFAYLALGVVRERTLLYGRRVLIAGIVAGAIPAIAVLVAAGAAGIVLFDEVVFVGSILPGVAAYNVHQLEGRRQAYDVGLSAVVLIGLLGAGVALIRPVAASRSATLLPAVLLAPESDIAGTMGVSVGRQAFASTVPFRVGAPVIVAGLVLSEFVQGRWGIRLSGIIATPLVALFALQDAHVLPFYLTAAMITYVVVAFVMAQTLLYGRVVLAIALVVSALVALPTVFVLPVEMGLLAFFTGIFAGIGVYNLQRVQPGERFASVAVTAGAFVVFLAAMRYFVQPPVSGLLTEVEWYHYLVGAPVVAVAVWQAYDLERRQPSLEPGRLGRWWRSARHLVRRGREHRRRLSRIDSRIVVSGTRGKSGTTKRLHDIFVERGRDTAAKITGNRPVMLHNGESHPVERGAQVTMYENEREIREHTPEDVLILENQAITGYTNHVVNNYFVKPHVVFFTNVRQDHLDTLGENRVRIARSFARSVPDGIHVVNGEQDERLREYLEDELEPRGVSVTHVDVPAEHRDVPGTETIYGLSTVLSVLGEDPLSPDQIELYLEDMRVEWTELPGGRVFNAAQVNDVESTEATRRALQGGTDEPITPFIYLRTDRRSRTASFLRYLSALHEEGRIAEAHVAGSQTGVFQRKAEFPVVVHHEDRGAGAILDDLLATGRPVLIMGNTVASFMRELEDEIDSRAAGFEFGQPTVPVDEGGGEPVDGRTRGGDEQRFPHALSIETIAEGDEAGYRFEVTGDVRKSRDRGASIDGVPRVDDGVVAGTVSDGIDSYRFTGRLLAVELDGPATVYLDGDRIDPDATGEVRRVERQ